MKHTTLVLLTSAIVLSLGIMGAYNLSKTQQVTKIPAHVEEAFNTWKSQYRRLYGSPNEHQYRLKNFYSNFLKIQQMKTHKISFTMALNKFADLSEDEFRGKYLTLKEPKTPSNGKPFQATLAASNEDIPDWIDWREKGAVNKVVAQHECGSCWAFVGLVAVEGAWKISGRNLEKFAEQQLVDCAFEFGAEGCSGGWMEYVYEYIIKKGGVMRGSDYPYVARVQACKADPSKFVGKMKDYLSIPAGDCRSMQIALTYNPLGSAIDAGYMPWYQSGVYDYPECGDWLNHAVSIVGYGTDWENGKQYWLVRNTFGEDWGESGYIRMDRNVQTHTGICGLCKRASFPLAAD